MPSTLDLAARLSAIVAAQQDILKLSTDSASVMRAALDVTQKITKADGAAIEQGDAYRAVSGHVIADPGAHPAVGSMLSAPLIDHGGALKVFAAKPDAFDDLDRYSVELLAGMLSAALRVAKECHERRESEERYKLLFEQNVAGVFRTTPDGRILDCNSAFAGCLGYGSREEVLARNTWDLYAERADREAFLDVLERHRALTNHHLRLKRKDGTAFAGIVTVSLIPGEAGAPQLLGTLVAERGS